MCTGIAMLQAAFGPGFFEEFGLEERLAYRDGQAEVRFLFGDPIAQLPVLIENQLSIIEWGNRNDKTSKLPRTGWCRQESLEAGKWRWLSPAPVVIPASYGLEKSVWFPIREGMCGVIVKDKQEQPHVYMLTQAASEPYHRMTGHARMPVLIGQEI